ncbi:hypothetical protein CPB84DRAFT_1706795, partial [Gymnopilus junonius]
KCLIDGVHIKDGRKVVSNWSEEIPIVLYLNSVLLKADVISNTVEILDIIPIPHCRFSELNKSKKQSFNS